MDPGALPAYATGRMDKGGVRELFDGLALEYAHERDLQPSFLAQKREVLALLDGAGGRLLDIGCGPACMEGDLLSRGFEVVGLDVSLEMLRHGLQRLRAHPFGHRCRLELGDVERLGFRDASFDAVICMGVLEYLAAYDRAISEIYRVLRPGGVAVATVPNRLSPRHVAGAAARLAKRALGRPREYAPNRCIPWRMARQLRRQGFHLLAHRYCGTQFIVSATRERL